MLLWEEYRAQQQEIRRGHNAVCHPRRVVEQHEPATQALWNESVLWAGAWQHAWTAEARKMDERHRYYQAQKEELWAKAKKDVKEAKKERRRAGTLKDTKRGVGSREKGERKENV